MVGWALIVLPFVLIFIGGAWLFKGLSGSWLDGFGTMTLVFIATGALAGVIALGVQLIEHGHL